MPNRHHRIAVCATASSCVKVAHTSSRSPDLGGGHCSAYRQHIILLACLQLAAGAVADFKPSKKGTALRQAGQKRQGMGQLQRTLTRMQTVLEAEAHLGCDCAAS